MLGVGIALILLAVAPVGVALLLANLHGKPSAAPKRETSRKPASTA